MRSRGPIRETSRGPVGQSDRAFHPSFVSKFARAAGTQYNERAGRKEGLVIVNGDIFVWECRLSSSFLYLFFHSTFTPAPPALVLRREPSCTHRHHSRRLSLSDSLPREFPSASTIQRGRRRLHRVSSSFPCSVHACSATTLRAPSISFLISL